MKKAFAIFLTLCLTFQCLMQLGLVAWYEANKEYVTATLCENKDKPELNCCGKCYLKKQMRKTEDRGTGKQIAAKEIKLAVFILPTQESICLHPSIDKLPLHSNYQAIQSHPALRDIFHPPSHSC